MYDINFFSVNKKKRSKSNGFKIFIIVFLGVFIVANVLMVGGGYWKMTGYEKSITDKESFINSQETKDKIDEAARIKQEATLTNEYLTLLQRSSDKLAQMNHLNTDFLQEIRDMTPPATKFTFTEYNSLLVNLECTSSVITDPMDMYHAFLNNPIFATVSLAGITKTPEGQYTFSIISQLAGGASK